VPCQTTCMSSTRPAAAADRVPSLPARASSLLRRAWRVYWERRARRATIMILHSLDCRTLRDIGISPSEIESLVQCGGDRRRRYDAGWLWL
jgi:uncharacterized protein YjiS (DUF1127 family)